MKAVVLRGGNAITLEDRTEPEPAPTEVLVRPHHCGICGTDLHAPLLSQLYSPDVVLGHEFAGEVVTAGADVTGWGPGDRVVINPNGDVCGACRECRTGRYNLCNPEFRGKGVGIRRDGGMAEYVTLPAVMLHRLPEGVTTVEGAWVEPLAVALRVVRRAGIQVGDGALVLGAGPIGLLVLQVLRRAGAGHVTVVEPSSSRRETADRLGASATVDPRQTVLEEVIGSRLPEPEHVFECAGIPRGIAIGAEIVRPQGSITVVGISPEPLDLRIRGLFVKEAVVRTSRAYVEEFPMAIELIEQGSFDLETMTTDVVPLDSYAEAVHRMERTDGVVKILLQP